MVSKVAVLLPAKAAFALPLIKSNATSNSDGATTLSIMTLSITTLSK
jgi:hypothetical protein